MVRIYPAAKYQYYVNGASAGYGTWSLSSQRVLQGIGSLRFIVGRVSLSPGNDHKLPARCSAPNPEVAIIERTVQNIAVTNKNVENFN